MVETQTEVVGLCCWWRIVGSFQAKGWDKCCPINQMISYYMFIYVCCGSGGALRGLSLGHFGFLHLVEGVLQILLQPPDLRVHAHLFVCLQLSNDLEGAVWCVDEAQLSDVGSWEAVDRGATVTSLHQTDGLGLWWMRVKEHHERSHGRQQLHIHPEVCLSEVWSCSQ